MKIAAESDAQADEIVQRAVQWKSYDYLCRCHLQRHNFLRGQMHNAILVLDHAFELEESALMQHYQRIAL